MLETSQGYGALRTLGGMCLTSNTVTATPLILITQGQCLDDLEWHREDPHNLVCSGMTEDEPT